MADEQPLTDADQIADDVAAYQEDHTTPPQTLEVRLKMAKHAFAEGQRALSWLGYADLAEKMDLPIRELNEAVR